MSSARSVCLLELEPDIARFLTREERAEAARLAVPVVTVPRSTDDLDHVLEDATAFGALVVSGVLAQRLQLGRQSAMRLLGPGDVVSRSSGRSSPLTTFGFHAVAETTLALLGKEILMAVHRWPRLTAGLNVRMAEQSERVAAQMVICQFPRVEERLLAFLWLLAESWGRVTSAGTVLPLSLTHETLGELVGARRPTVTLALKELSERGAVIRQGRGWLLLERLEEPDVTPPSIEEPALLDIDLSAWGDRPEREDGHPLGEVDSWSELRESLLRLREEHQRHSDRFEDRLRRTRSVQENASLTRERLRVQLNRRRPAPS